MFGKYGVSIDTVRIYWICSCVNYRTWRCKNDIAFIKLLGGALKLTYLIDKYMLIAEFSASRIANGCNVIPYKSSQYEMLKTKVENAVSAATGRTVRLDHGCVSRIDTYIHINLKTLEDAEKLIEDFQNIPDMNRMKRLRYGSVSEYVFFNRGDMLKAYVKNHDKNVSVSISPTVRVEAEIKGKANAKKLIGGLCADEVLRDPLLWARMFNRTLESLKRDGEIYSRAEFVKETKRIIKKEKPKTKDATAEKKIQALCRLLTGKEKNKNRSVSDLVRLLVKNGVCPCISEYIRSLKIIITEKSGMIKKKAYAQPENVFAAPRPIRVFLESFLPQIDDSS